MSSADHVPAQRVQLLLRHRNNLASYIRRVTRTGGDADDIFQEVGLVVLRHRTGPTDLATADAWLRGVARRVLLQHHRVQARLRRATSDEVLDLFDRGEQEQEADVWSERRSALAACLQELSAEDRTILTDRYAHDLDSTTIAQRLGRSPEAVRMKIMRLRQALSRSIQRRLEARAGT
jgi:RNA polymerase sigma-70 factor, ECF subfamily